jgi:predicted transcriptional regulator of viral defense system
LSSSAVEHRLVREGARVWTHFVTPTVAGSDVTLWVWQTQFVTARFVDGLECHEMSSDGRVLALARGSEGVVTSAELANAGLSPTAIAHRVKTGWLVRWHRGVFLVGPLEAPLSRARAAVLAVGDGAVLSHFAAAVVWELRAHQSGPVDVTLPGRNARNRPGIRIHRVAQLHPADITVHRNLPVTSPARTLLDLARFLPSRALTRAIEEAEVQRRVTPHSLDEQFKRYPRHRGTQH